LVKHVFFPDLFSFAPPDELRGEQKKLYIEFGRRKNSPMVQKFTADAALKKHFFV